MSKAGPEGAVIKAAMKLLKDRGAVGSKTQGTLNSRGEPDLVFCYRGRFLALECKAPGKRNSATPLQLARLAEYHASGAVAVVFDDVEQIRWILDECDARRAVSNIALNHGFRERWPR